MDTEKPIHIDSAIRQLLEKYPVAEGSDYGDFLQRLAEHDKNKVLLDTVLEEKLSALPDEPAGPWKRIIAIIWFRRIRNIAIVLLTALAAIMTIQYQMGHHNQSIAKPTKNNRAVVETTPRNLGSLKDNPVHPGVILTTPENTIINNAEQFAAFNSGNNTTTSSAGQNNKNGTDKQGLPLTLAEEEGRSKLTISGLQKSVAFNGIAPEQITLLPLVKLSALNHHNTSLFDRIPKTGFVVGFQLNNSFQTWHSTVNANSETTNRDYADLSGSGRKTSYTLNYGLTLEKNIFKGFGLSLGAGKLTLRQQQTTDYILTEAPVFDLDGHIAGYISITPEKIQTKIDNRVDYIIFPVNLMYGFTLKPGNSLQIKAGSSLTSELKKQTEKFNYSSLLLEPYNSGGKPLSMNNIQYGIAYTRQLRGPVLLSLGYERQVFNKVNALSDPTEKTGATIHNFNISLKYKL